MRHVVSMSASKVFSGLIHGLSMSFWKRLGSCPRCVRSAFRATFVAWVLTGFSQAISCAPPVLALTRIAAFTLTALWFGHLLAHAIKVSAAARREKGFNNSVAVSRRNMLPIFARTLATALVATSIPALAFADCNQAATERCQAAAANCRANCDHTFHREEANRACHQECYSSHVACRDEAKSIWLWCRSAVV